LATDKIKRNFIWLRKVLELIDQTTLPGQVIGDVSPTMDLFGWDRIREAVVENALGAGGANIALAAVVPEDRIQVVFEASVRSSDAANAQDLWVAHRSISRTSIDVAVSPTFRQDVGFNGSHASTGRIILLSPGERLIGRSNPAPAGGNDLTLSLRSLNLPFGEYIYGL